METTSNTEIRLRGPLKASDLFSLEQYARQRGDFRNRVIEHKKHRKIAIGTVCDKSMIVTDCNNAVRDSACSQQLAARHEKRRPEDRAPSIGLAVRGLGRRCPQLACRRRNAGMSTRSRSGSS